MHYFTDSCCCIQDHYYKVALWPHILNQVIHVPQENVKRLTFSHWLSNQVLHKTDMSANLVSLMSQCSTGPISKRNWSSFQTPSWSLLSLLYPKFTASLISTKILQSLPSCKPGHSVDSLPSSYLRVKFHTWNSVFFVAAVNKEIQCYSLTRLIY